MIHLVNMPFAFLTCPNLALSVFKSQIVNAGFQTRVFNLNFSFAQAVGFKSYLKFSFTQEIDPRISEWLFAHQVWGDFEPEEEAFLSLCSDYFPKGQSISKNKDWLVKVRNELVPAWLSRSADYLAQSGKIEVVGFSCSFFQTLPALALGRVIKQKFSNAKLIYGGPCFHGPMGKEIINNAEWIDVVCPGEGDDIIIPLVYSVLQNHELSNLPGLFFRTSSGDIKGQDRTKPVSSRILDSLPVPDFNDFFTDAHTSGLTQDPWWQKRAFLPFESARGCWKAAKEHCRFCGTNSTPFRVKSSEKIVHTLNEYRKNYPLHHYHAIDSNLAPHFFHKLFNILKHHITSQGVSLFYEVVTTLNQKQIHLMAQTGITYVQAGIESLNTRLLTLMNKSVTALQNIFFLKCCAAYNIIPLWNFLFRVPGETEQDYKEMEHLIPKLFHFRPPISSPSPIQCHRFSPYFEQRDMWTESVSPAPWYEGLYPSDKVQLENVAYYFDAQWKNVLNMEQYNNLINSVNLWISKWTSSTQPPQLIIKHIENKEGITIYDTRGTHTRLWHLDSLQTIMYNYLSVPSELSLITQNVREQTKRTEKDMLLCLEEFIEHGLAIMENNVYLGLAVTLDDFDFRNYEIGVRY
jgi:ribosomal peptide maturation radical SAM protein 1